MMFGKAVEQDIQNKTRDMKNEKSARAKAVRLFNSWMVKEGDTPVGAFRDPMSRIQ